MAMAESEDFIALKSALHCYAQYRASLPEEQRASTARELGALLLALVGVADRLGVDLVRAAEEAVERRAANVPRLVPIARPRDPKIS
jgi:hypothetical protein